jgi:hypothetical protein
MANVVLAEGVELGSNILHANTGNFVGKFRL